MAHKRDNYVEVLSMVCAKHTTSPTTTAIPAQQVAPATTAQRRSRLGKTLLASVNLNALHVSRVCHDHAVMSASLARVAFRDDKAQVVTASLIAHPNRTRQSAVEVVQR